MTDVADISPGTVLRATATGRTYRIQADGDERVIVKSPTGTISVDRDELQADITRGKIEV